MDERADFSNGSSTSVLIASNKSADFGLRPNCIPFALAGGVEDRLTYDSTTVVVVVVVGSNAGEKRPPM